MLVARKPENWRGLLNVAEYVFQDTDMEALATGFVSQKKSDNTLRARIINKIIKRLNKLK